MNKVLLLPNSTASSMNDGLILNKIQQQKQKGEKALAVLIDPESATSEDIAKLVKLSIQAQVDYFFVGGSTATHDDMDWGLSLIKELTDIPTLIFPGNTSQLSNKADGLLFLSMISGRNPDLLIGKQVESVPFLMKNEIEVIPTGYLLLDGGCETTVAYVSNTTPIPADKPDITLATAMAGQYLGLQMIYLEAGSGAINPVATATISKVSKALSLPLIVGGGIRTAKRAEQAAKAGADLIVIGNILEKDPNLVIDISIAIHHVSKKAML